jgi:prevent-host-death family protein
VPRDRRGFLFLLTLESSPLGFDLAQVEDPIDTLLQGPRVTPGLIRGSVVVQIAIELLYIWQMDVAISTLRAELSTWIERARSGEEIVVTERGTPVARLLAVDAAPLLDQLIASGVLSKPRRDDRPAARGAARAHASGPVSELVSEQRR